MLIKLILKIFRKFSVFIKCVHTMSLFLFLKYSFRAGVFDVKTSVLFYGNTLSQNVLQRELFEVFMYLLTDLCFHVLI